MRCRLDLGPSQPVDLAPVDRYLQRRQQRAVAAALALVPLAVLLAALVVGAALGGGFGVSLLLLPLMVTARIAVELGQERRQLARARALLGRAGAVVTLRARALWITAGGERVEVPVGDRRLLGLGPPRAALPPARLVRAPR